MRRLSNNRELFEADKLEKITVTIAAKNTPYEVTFSELQSGGEWKQIQEPTPQNPVEIRTFTMPEDQGEFFNILYTFPPSGQANDDAEYRVTLTGKSGTSDGPKRILPPPAGDVNNLPYDFRLPRVATPDH